MARTAALALLVACAVFIGSGARAAGEGAATPGLCAQDELSWDGISDRPVGERIALWADSFVGTPYDTIPIGLYVESEKLVCDSEVDCMYLVFRSAELGTSGSPGEAEQRALELRFVTKGHLEDGRVVNYDERFQYAEDMIASGRWGDDITSQLGGAEAIPGDRGRDSITMLPREEAMKPGPLARLRDGDIVYFVKDPSKRVVGEIIGHMGIIKVEDGTPMLIHASGNKRSKTREGGGEVKKVPFSGYLDGMKFIGIQVTRFGG